MNSTVDLSELNKLEAYLKEKNIPYERLDQEETHSKVERHQISVPSHYNRKWDAICQPGSYGCIDGLLEIMGTIASENIKDKVEGWLTAEDVIKRIEAKHG